MDFDKLDHDYLMKEERPDPIIPFGEHHGKDASQIDVKYLDWLIGQDWLFKDLREQIIKHLEGRQDWRQL